MRIAGIILGAVFSAGAAATQPPTSQPATTRPAPSNVARAKAALDEAEKALATAHDRAATDARASTAVQKALKGESQKLALLQRARAGDSASEKLSASSAYNRVRKDREKLEADAIAADPRLKKAVDERATAMRELSDAEADEAARLADQRRQQAAADAKDPIKRAIKENRLVVGMTVEQANKAMGGPGRLIYESDGAQQFEWPIYQRVSKSYGRDGRTTVVTESEVRTGADTAVFRNGKLTEHERE